MFLSSVPVDESPENDEEDESDKKKTKKKKGGKGKDKKSAQNKMMVSVDTLKKAKGGKCQAILGVQQGLQKLTVNMLFNKSSSSSEPLRDLDNEETEPQKPKKRKKEKFSKDKDNKNKDDVQTPETKEHIGSKNRK